MSDQPLQVLDNETGWMTIFPDGPSAFCKIVGAIAVQQDQDGNLWILKQNGEDFNWVGVDDTTKPRLKAIT